MHISYYDSTVHCAGHYMLDTVDSYTSYSGSLLAATASLEVVHGMGCSYMGLTMLSMVEGYIIVELGCKQVVPGCILVALGYILDEHGCI